MKPEIGDRVTITDGNFTGKTGRIMRVVPGMTLYYEIASDDDRQTPYPPVLLTDSQFVVETEP